MNGMNEERKPLLLRKTLSAYSSVMPKGANQQEHHTTLHVERPIYQQDELNRDTLYEKPKRTFKEVVKHKYRRFSCCDWLLRLFPVLKWMPEYSWKRDLAGDAIAGVTVAIMQIPQGMAYGLLGEVPPVVGMYTAFFPVLIYFFFGTSRHVSMGTFAVVCLMTGKVVMQHATEELLQNGTMVHVEDADGALKGASYTNVEVAVTVTFTVAVLLSLMYFLRLGIVAALLSETMVSGFTCASSLHVVSSQLKDLLGLPIGKRRGYFRIIYVLYDAILALPKANRVTVSISMVCCVAISINNEIFKPWLTTKTRIPFPIELVAVVIGTAVSYFVNLEGNYNVTVVGYIPTGLPEPALPAFELIPDILADCFVITMVSYSITMSMALIFAQKHHYEVDSNQELLAMGVSNFVGSFFSCLCVTASLSRSMIQEAVGGVTQLASVISCGLLLSVLLWIGPVFETLPRCVLASIIIVALKGMVMQCTAISRYWKLSKWDALVWVVTFCTTLFVDISIGLAAGAVLSMISVFAQGYDPYACLLEAVPDTDLYLDSRRYKGTREIPGVKIFHYTGGLSFASRASFRSTLFAMTGFDPNLAVSARSRDGAAAERESLALRCLILDFMAVTYVDPAGVHLLRQLQLDYAKLDISLYIAGCSGPVFETFKRCDKHEGKECKFLIFPTVHDAVCYAQTNVLYPDHKIT